MGDFDPTLPLERARTIPGKWYTDSAEMERERSSVFGQSWQCIARSEQVRSTGEYVTAEIAGEPVLVIRSMDGVLRGFFNVCRHRAAPLLTDCQGRTNKLRCRYHGWTYGLSGDLLGVPEFDGVQNFHREDHGLVPLGAVLEVGGFIWVSIGKPGKDVEATFPEFFAAEYGTSRYLVFHSRRIYDVACNWKVYVDNYLDGGYHVNTVHPELAEALDYKNYRTDVFAESSVQRSPMKALEGILGATRTGEAEYWWLFPNFMVNRYSGVLDTNLVLPVAVDRCRVVFDFYFTANHDEAFRVESLRVANAVQDEDRIVCEGVQRGLGSSSYRTGRFSVRREAGGYHFHRLLAARRGEP